MRHRIWLLLLVAGLAVLAKPVGRRARRAWRAWRAAGLWEAVQSREPAGLPGEPVCWLRVPSAGISQLVRRAGDEATLGLSPCLEPIGRSTLILAHRDIHFSRLGKVESGDAIELELRGAPAESYRCLETLVLEKDAAEAFVRSQRNRNRLLLVTCHPFRYIGAAPNRFIVVAAAEDGGAQR